MKHKLKTVHPSDIIYYQEFVVLFFNCVCILKTYHKLNTKREL